MSLDLLFIISKLGDKLPDDYLSFKKIVRNNLECIYDTKYLFEEFKNSKYNINNCIVKDIKSVLDCMYPYLKSSFDKFVKIKIKTKEELLKEEKYHSAGYDSYITGACFLYMKYAMENYNNFLIENKNKIYLMNSLYKSMDINKDEDEYIMEVNDPNENIFIFRGVRKVTDICFDKIFGKILLGDSVIKLISEEKNNILVIFTNFDNKNNISQKTTFRTIANSKINRDKFAAFILGEYRNKYMKKNKNNESNESNDSKILFMTWTQKRIEHIIKTIIPFMIKVIIAYANELIEKYNIDGENKRKKIEKLVGLKREYTANTKVEFTKWLLETEIKEIIGQGPNKEGLKN
jgi:hypothetical protein